MKKLYSILLSLLLLIPLTQNVWADQIYGEDGLCVAFTQNNEMEQNFSSDKIDDVLNRMQPGDTAYVHLELANKNEASTDWYMSNKVLSSLEDSVSVAGGGAYVYELIYIDHEGSSHVLFSSDEVGGENISQGGEGLHEATNALDDFFYLDTLARGQTGKITLEINLDGETQGNDYQDTVADLQMNFAVALSSDSSTPPSSNPPYTTNTPKTGDPTDLLKYYLMGGVSGLLFLILALYSLYRISRKKEVTA